MHRLICDNFLSFGVQISKMMYFPKFQSSYQKFFSSNFDYKSKNEIEHVLEHPSFNLELPRPNDKILLENNRPKFSF